MTRSWGRAGLSICSLTLALVPACDDDSGPGGALPGYLSVLVTDPVLGPVPDQEITITPSAVTATTNAEGIVMVTLLAGDYVVDAEVCCVGPGFITYHEPARVVEKDTTHITLTACLTCE